MIPTVCPDCGCGYREPHDEDCRCGGSNESESLTKIERRLAVIEQRLASLQPIVHVYPNYGVGQAIGNPYGYSPNFC